MYRRIRLIQPRQGLSMPAVSGPYEAKCTTYLLFCQEGVCSIAEKHGGENASVTGNKRDH